MEITHLGHSCFLLKTKTARVVCDPFGKSVGFKQAKINADIVTISHDHDDHNDLSFVVGEPMIINGPGEYEIKGVSITGIACFHDEKKGKDRGKNIIYVFDVDELRVAHLGDLGHKLSDKELEIMDGVDVLMVPIGGEFTINSKIAKEVIKQVSPSVVVPMHYKTKEHNKKFSKLTTLKDFTKEMEIEAKKEKKLKIKKLDLPEEMELVILDKYGR